MTQLKDIHMGKCLEDLKPFYKVPNDRRIKLQMVLKTISKIDEKAEKYLLDKDEEMSYIYFMKYMFVVEMIRKHPDYCKQKEDVHKIIGGNKRIQEILDKTESLSKSLNRRYQLLKESQKVYHNPVVESTRDEENNDSKYFSSSSYVTRDELKKLTEDPNASILIIDCRTSESFNYSRLEYYYCINVPAEIIVPGLSADKINTLLESNSKKMWSARAIKDYIILMDLKSPGPDPLIHTPIWYLKDVLQNWDPDIKYKSPIRMLEGGYQNFIFIYPTLCTNSNLLTPAVENFEIDLEEIEYPSIKDITMKDDVRYNDNSIHISSISIPRPSINRDSKAAALKTYNEKDNKKEILDEQEKLLEKMLQTDRERLDAENQWESVNIQKNTLESKDNGTEQLIYKIMQLESKQKDLSQENEHLRQKIQEYDLKDSNEIISEKEAEKEEEVAKRIENKYEEHKQIEEKWEKITRERVKQLAIAREQKRKLKPTVDDDEVVSNKIPQFDRSVKPSVVATPRSFELIRRDFAPVPGSPGRGLTGLKNLGNTCYMNSIMQCLSNTNSLVEYLLKQDYKKHINRSNKTQGRIVEEVAELIKVLWSGKYKCVAGQDLRYVLGEYQQIFRGIQQQDSHEFLTILMDWLHSDLQTLEIMEKPSENLPAAKKAWLEFTKSRESLILRLFYGQIKSTVICTNCKKESATYECFSNLSLELPSTSKDCNLVDCLNMYFDGEHIQGYNCPSCKGTRNAIKKLDISQLPPILVIHFKRFYADPDSTGNTYKKKLNYIKFSLNKFDMYNYIARSVKNSEPRRTYNLYAVSNHYGSMECGHYTAFCKSITFNKWFKYDDQVVSSLDTSDVNSSAAYILFYTYLDNSAINEEF